MTLSYEAEILNSKVEITIKYLGSYGVLNRCYQVGKVQAFISGKEYSYDLQREIAAF